MPATSDYMAVTRSNNNAAVWTALGLSPPGTASGDITGAVSVVSLADYGVTRLGLPHGVDRLDAIGADAIAIGSGRGALGFSAIDLAGTPRIADTFLLPNAREGETRSHAFFFRPDPDSRDGSGLLGLPVARFLDRRGQPQGNSAGILFLNRRGGKLSEAGALNGSTVAGSNADDGCQASCADWYGNARPIFIGDRIFALLGYELVEGTARVNAQTGDVISAAAASLAAIPEKWRSNGSSPRPPWRSGNIAASVDGGRGGPLTLKRSNVATGAALPDRLLSKNAVTTISSLDQHHLLAAERVGAGGEEDPEYRWVIFAMETGDRITELRRDVSAGPFFLWKDNVVFESPAHGFRSGGVWVDEPLQIRAVRASSGSPVWTSELRDLEYRGPLPPGEEED